MVTPDLGPRLIRDQRYVQAGSLWSLVALGVSGLAVVVCAGGCLAGVGTGRFDDWMLAVGAAAVTAAGVLACAAALTVVARQLARRRETVTVYQRGLVWEQGGQSRVFPWNRLVGLRRSPDRAQFRGPVDRPLRCSLAHEDQQTLTLSEFPNLGAVIGEIERLTALTWIPPWTAALQRGEPVRFGAIVLERSGIQGFGDEVPWSEVVSLGVNRADQLELMTRAGPRAGPLFEQVPNPHVLFVLVERRRAPR